MKRHFVTTSPQLKILRQLVELQLCHAPDIKATIDRAWGVVHNKHKKNQQPAAPPEPSDPKSRQNLTLHPIGQDSQRKRFWVADGPCTTVFLSLCLDPYLRIFTRESLISFFSSGTGHAVQYLMPRFKVTEADLLLPRA